ncbi:CRISPR-associated endonuclease Cas1 [Rothia uropygioeca]|uniref:CRISPR-associated endonuclease Cas1 n=1 Tax=Kocuria sp. 257 TaxID=2021970 RepID=UPI00101011B1|nr:CRISPR-associated endonuclease Cas1 [Kocuria sp. 257]
MNQETDQTQESIPISWVGHHQFCPRRAWLEASDEKARQSAQIEQGTFEHRRAHDPSQNTSDTFRAVDVRSKRWGIHGRIDIAEGSPETGVTLLEYKATPVRKIPEISTSHRIQLTLQRAALLEAGIPVIAQGVYFTGHKRRVLIDLDEEDEAQARAAVEATRAVVDAAKAPEALEDDPRCRHCSHAVICLPEERKLQEIPHQIQVADPEGTVLHATTPGSRVSISKGRVTVKKFDERLASVPIEKVQSIVVHGNVDLSGALIREFMWRGRPIVWCTGTGRVVGWSQPAAMPNGSARIRQHVLSAEGHLPLAREFIQAKIANQATQVRRYGIPRNIIASLRSLQKAVSRSHSLSEIMGLEGKSARLYFQQVPKMLQFSDKSWLSEGFAGRIGRGAVDPVNVALNYAYGMLAAEAIRAIASCGLDPHAGFLHSGGRNKPALALDLMEEFRAPIADSAVFRAFNNGELRQKSFNSALGSARLTDQGRKAIIRSVEQRVSTEFRHPIFGYSVSWRRAIEIQARLVLGVIDGTQSSYRGIVTR